MDLAAFIEKWSQSNAAERANKDLFFVELCDMLGVPRPDPTTSDPERDRYVFERDALLVAEGEKRSVGKIDLYKDGCFLLEAKQGSEAGGTKIGTAKRGTPGWNVAMHGAYGQALGYARTFDRPPPFLVTCGKLGVGNDPRHHNTRCFDPFPFPAATDAQRARIRELGEALDVHRKRQQAQYPDLTITGMYNVLEKLRSGEALTAKDKKIHERGLVSTLRQIHDDLDAAVFDAYGWPRDLTDERILESLAALGLVLAFEAGGTRRWKAPTRAAA